MPRLARAGVLSAMIACTCSSGIAGALPTPTPIGVGPRFQPSAFSGRVLSGSPIGRLRCRTSSTAQRAHVELFARDRVVVVPARIGVSPRGCVYPVRTREPTGVVEFESSATATVGDVFAVWGRRLSSSRLLSFSGQVRVYIAGRRVRIDPRRVELRRHAEIVLEVGPYVPPHRGYLFPAGR